MRDGRLADAFADNCLSYAEWQSRGYMLSYVPWQSSEKLASPARNSYR